MPQDATQNLGGGDWNITEQSWARELKKGHKVKVKIELHYSGDSPRPDSFQVYESFSDSYGNFLYDNNFPISN